MNAWARLAPRLPLAEWRALWAARIGRLLVIGAAALALATIAGLIALWPRSSSPVVSDQAAQSESAVVVAVAKVPCDTGECRSLEFELESGSDRGRSTKTLLAEHDPAPDYSAGQHVRVLRGARAGDGEPGAASPGDLPPGAIPAPRGELPGAVAGTKPVAEYAYSIVDYDRRGSLGWLAAAFALLVIVVARLRGALALIGLGVSMLIISQFVVPAIVADHSPFLVALVGSLAAMLVTIAMTSGLTVQSLAAALGIAASLLLAATLGLGYVHIAHLDGSGSELAFTLSQSNPGLSLQGLVLAGFVIGALGVLADMAVTQASAVMALRRANAELGVADLYREAFVVGRDHLSATVNTLVFAYVGASLPLLLLFEAAGVSFTDAINGQDVAESVVATLVGSIGVVASIPLTTGLAALLASGLPPAAIPADAHGHHH
jgi:hypothetical protein